MKIKDIFTQYERCKLCNLILDTRLFKRSDDNKQQKNKYRIFDFNTTKNIADIINNKIVVIDEGPYGTKISELIIDIETDICTGSEVKNYEYSPLQLQITRFCPKVFSKSFDLDMDDRDSLYTKSCKDEAYPVIPDSHYGIDFSIQIDQKAKEIVSVEKEVEHFETNDFQMTKDYHTHSTRIERKIKVISLPFVLEKDLKDFDFDKVLNNTKLLK